MNQSKKSLTCTSPLQQELRWSIFPCPFDVDTRSFLRLLQMKIILAKLIIGNKGKSPSQKASEQRVSRRTKQQKILHVKLDTWQIGKGAGRQTSNIKTHCFFTANRWENLLLTLYKKSYYLLLYLTVQQVFFHKKRGTCTRTNKFTPQRAQSFYQ